MHRSLNSSQRSLVAVGFLEYETKQAKARQIAAQNNNAGRAVVADAPQLENSGKARDKAGERMGVGGRNVDHAKTVLEKGIPVTFPCGAHSR